MNDVSGLRRMLDLDGVLAMVPISRTTIFRLEREGRFPASREISPKRRAWYEDEVLAWQRTLPANTRIRRKRRRSSENQ